jgi:hypothetical protein
VKPSDWTTLRPYFVLFGIDFVLDGTDRIFFPKKHCSDDSMDNMAEAANPARHWTSPLEYLRQALHSRVIVRRIIKGEIANLVLAELKSLKNTLDTYSDIFASMAIREVWEAENYLLGPKLLVKEKCNDTINRVSVSRSPPIKGDMDGAWTLVEGFDDMMTEELILLCNPPPDRIVRQMSISCADNWVEIVKDIAESPSLGHPE